MSVALKINWQILLENTPTPENRRPFDRIRQFLSRGTKVLEADALEASPYVNHFIQTIPIRFTVDLQQLSPGTYDCQVTVLDLSHRMTAFSRTSVAMVP